VEYKRVLFVLIQVRNNETALRNPDPVAEEHILRHSSGYSQGVLQPSIQCAGKRLGNFNRKIRIGTICIFQSTKFQIIWMTKMIEHSRCFYPPEVYIYGFRQFKIIRRWGQEIG